MLTDQHTVAVVVASRQRTAAEDGTTSAAIADCNQTIPAAFVQWHG